MLYPPELVQPMREDLTRAGIQELTTAEEVTSALHRTEGSTLLVVNSVCGCAAGNARPGVHLALSNPRIPDRMYTVFAGQDREATEEARKFLAGYPPSSPAIALFRDGELVLMLERKDIEGRTAQDVAHDLIQAFDRNCTREAR